MHCRLLCLLVILAGLVTTSTAFASGGPIVIDVEPGSCLDSQEIERGVFARIRRPRGRGEPGETRLHVRIDSERSPFTATVTIEEPGEPAVERRVSAATCGETAFAVILVAALAVDFDAEGARAASSKAQGGDDGLAQRADAASAAERANAGAGRPPDTRLALGGHVGMGTDASRATPSGDLFFDRQPTRAAFALGLRLAVGAARITESAGAARVHLTALTLRPELSLLHAGTGPLRSSAGVALEAGAAFGSSAGSVRSVDETRPWLRAGPALRGSVEVLGPVAVELDASVLAAVVRDTFVVEPGGESYRVPFVTLVARLGVVVGLP